MREKRLMREEVMGEWLVDEAMAAHHADAFIYAETSLRREMMDKLMTLLPLDQPRTITLSMSTTPPGRPCKENPRLPIMEHEYRIRLNIVIEWEVLA